MTTIVASAPAVAAVAADDGDDGFIITDNHDEEVYFQRRYPTHDCKFAIGEYHRGICKCRKRRKIQKHMAQGKSQNLV